MHFKEVEKKCLSLLQLQKNNDEHAALTLATLFMASILFITILAHFIKYGFDSKALTILIVMVISFIFYKQRITTYYEKNLPFKGYLDLKNSDTKAYIENLKNYLSTGLDLKFERIRTSKIFFIICFGSFLLLIKEILHDKLEYSDLFASCALAFGLSFIGWSVFFSSDLRFIKDLQEELSHLYVDPESYNQE